MTTQEIAAELCKGEKGVQQVTIAQMCEIVKVLKRKLAGRQCARLLNGLLSSVVVALFVGCAQMEQLGLLAQSFIIAQVDANVPGEYTVKIEKGDEPGEYTMTMSKDGKVRKVEHWTCDGFAEGRLSGCHKR